MSVYRLSVSVISRGAGRSALAAAAYRAAAHLVELGRDAITSAIGAAAYRSGSEISSDDGRSFDFRKKRGVVFTAIQTPDNAPVWMGDRERLWNAVEASEKRRDARLARETQLALPRELDRESQVELARGFIAEQMVARGMVVDWAIHDVEARDGGRQPHCHAMCTTREVDPDKPLGFGRKIRAWDDVSLVIAWREAWAEHVNRALEARKIPERVDHRTLEAQRGEAARAGDFDRAAALDREPEPKVGWRAWALEESGHRTERGDMLRDVQGRNVERREVYDEVAASGDDAAKARFLELREDLGDAFDAFVAWADGTLEQARAWTRGAAVAAGIGAAVLGGGLERDTFVPEASAGVAAPAGLEDVEMLERAMLDAMIAEATGRERAGEDAHRFRGEDEREIEPEAWATDAAREPAIGGPDRDGRDAGELAIEAAVDEMLAERAAAEREGPELSR